MIINQNLFNKCCYICGLPIGEDRVNALYVLGKPLNMFTCIKCAQIYPEPTTKGVYTGETGTSQLILTNKVGNEKSLTEQENEKQELATELKTENVYSAYLTAKPTFLKENFIKLQKDRE